MPHDPALPTTRYGDPVHHPTPLLHPPTLPTIPPGIDLVTLPDGTRTLAYTHPGTPAPTTLPTPVPAGVPGWAKTTALLAPTVGGGIGAAGIGISYAAPGVLAMAEALWALVALIAAGAALPLLLRAGRRGTTGGGPAHHTHIHQSITATGLFGRAKGTIHHP
ncbi:hypothetical protein ACN20G_16650 [Streptomyces sp. BI20]|uniref:hypothetical protein n=1 Tax=Streptomyces sp. BI20 TaxID=3403460 RepID=UPI003C755407